MQTVLNALIPAAFAASATLSSHDPQTPATQPLPQAVKHLRTAQPMDA